MAYNQFNAYGAMLPQRLDDLGEQGQANLDSIVIKPPDFMRKRVRMNIMAIFVSLFVPWLLFTLLFADVSFRVHFKFPLLCWGLVLLGAVVVLGFGFGAGFNIWQLFRGSTDYQPTWLIFLSLTSLVAVVLGPMLGNTNFWQNMSPYYDLRNLNEYNYVDPTRMRGQQMMDAGRVDFLSGAMLDLRNAYAFQNLVTYCVAPITMYNPSIGGPTPLNSYDFWAVGTNCCGGNSTQTVDFKCGAYRSTTARQGLRLMSDDERAFFRLAVQQAESAHMIQATHPLFFYWTEDAGAQMNGYVEDAFKVFAESMIGFFAVQLCLVMALSYVLSKLGYNNL